MRALVQFGKQGRLRYVSHLDLQRFMQRALRRSAGGRFACNAEFVFGKVEERYVKPVPLCRKRPFRLRKVVPGADGRNAARTQVPYGFGYGVRAVVANVVVRQQRHVEQPVQRICRFRSRRKVRAGLGYRRLRRDKRGLELDDPHVGVGQEWAKSGEDIPDPSSADNFPPARPRAEVAAYRNSQADG